MNVFVQSLHLIGNSPPYSRLCLCLALQNWLLAVVFVLIMVCSLVYDGLAAHWMYDWQVLSNTWASMGNHGTFLSLGDSGSWFPPFIPLANDVGAQCCRSSCRHRWRKSAAMLKSRQGCGCFGSKELLENIVGPFWLDWNLWCYDSFPPLNLLRRFLWLGFIICMLLKPF